MIIGCVWCPPGLKFIIWDDTVGFQYENVRARDTNTVTDKMENDWYHMSKPAGPAGIRLTTERTTEKERKGNDGKG